MPTNKPRFTITTTKPVYDTVARLAALQGKSKSSVVNELLEAIHPPLMRTVALLEAAQDAPEEIKRNLRSTVLDMERDIAGSAGSGLAQMDWLLGKFHHGGKGAEDRRQPAGPISAPATPHSNTGVPTTKTRKPTTRARRSNG